MFVISIWVQILVKKMAFVTLAEKCVLKSLGKTTFHQYYNICQKFNIFKQIIATIYHSSEKDSSEEDARLSEGYILDYI